MVWQGLIRKYREFLPSLKDESIVSLHEGNTPLIYSEDLSRRVQIKVYIKYEGLNPTGSFKDRGMTMAISQAKEKGKKIVMCASTGNTSASAAAYSAYSGCMRCIVIIPDGNIALGKLAQAMIHKAKVISIKGNFDEALNIVKDITDQYPIELVNSINPFRIEGQKTASYEVCDALNEAPEFHAIPVGNAGNITAYWKGYKEYKDLKKIQQLPKMLGFQAEGSAPIVYGKVIENPKTIATAIRIGNPASWKQAEEVRDSSGGVIEAVSDQEILEAYKILAEDTGIFVEPASAASIAGVLKLYKNGYFDSYSSSTTVVCTVTGHGLKDPDRAMQQVEKPIAIDSNIKTIIKEIGL